VVADCVLEEKDISIDIKDAMIITVTVIHPNLRILIMTDNAYINHDKSNFLMYNSKIRE